MGLSAKNVYLAGEEKLESGQMFSHANLQTPAVVVNGKFGKGWQLVEVIVALLLEEEYEVPLHIIQLNRGHSSFESV